MTDPVVSEELDLLTSVAALLRVLPRTRTASQAPIVRELDRLREVLLSGDEAKDVSTLSEQYHHQSAVLDQLRRVGEARPVDASAPYFAHLRLREDGKDRDLCLGRTTCVRGGLRIVDWRDAPISKIFYAYRQGDEFDEEIAGRERVGEVVVRRMVRICDGELERVQAPEGDFVADPEAPDGWRCERSTQPRLSGGEEAAVRAFEPGQGGVRRLGSGADGRPMRADKRLPEITGLIDPDQFELITRPTSGFMVIRGAAGSGKTTVALHRVAYLAFGDGRIDGPETMVVVFSRALERFVGHVLPSLGLDHVRVTSYRDWSAELRRRHFPRLRSPHRQDTPSLVQRIKLSPLLSCALEEQIASSPGVGNGESALRDWASVLLEKDLLQRHADRHAPGTFSAADIERFVRWQRDRLDEFWTAMAAGRAVGAVLDPEDDALLLRAWQLRVGPLRGPDREPLQLRHVVVDEVQDFAPIEVELLLGCLRRGASITLAGDAHQQLVEGGGFGSWREFFDHLGLPGTEIDTLRVSYRSSRQIMEFANSLLGDLLEADVAPETPRSGPPVELFRFGDHGACVAFLADTLRDLSASEPRASVVILTPRSSSSAIYFEALLRCELPHLRRVADQDFCFEAGIEVTEVSQVKGLEFDYVIMVDADAEAYPDSSVSRRLLHVAATRAIHQLWITSVATPSPLLADLWGSVSGRAAAASSAAAALRGRERATRSCDSHELDEEPEQ